MEMVNMMMTSAILEINYVIIQKKLQAQMKSKKGHKYY